MQHSRLRQPVNFTVAVVGSTVASPAQPVTITGPIAVNQAVDVQANLTIPLYHPGRHGGEP